MGLNDLENTEAYAIDPAQIAQTNDISSTQLAYPHSLVEIVLYPYRQPVNAPYFVAEGPVFLLSVIFFPLHIHISPLGAYASCLQNFAILPAGKVDGSLIRISLTRFLYR